MRALRLGALAAAVAFSALRAGAAQTARVGGAADPGGTVVGRVCLDLDGDGACSATEPGVAGAHVRFEDGKVAVADDLGRFHALGLSPRAVLPDRSAYGAHAVSVDGLGVSRTLELAAAGAASVDLPVAPPPDASPAGEVRGDPEGSPALDGGRVVWPIEGTAPAGATVRAGAAEARAAADGRWALRLPLADGPNRITLAIEAADGRIAIWSARVHVARPFGGSVRAYPSRPVLLVAASARAGPGGLLLAGRAAPGAVVEVGGLRVRPAADGAFAAWSPEGVGFVRLAVRLGEEAAEHALAAPGDAGRLQGVLLGELELQAGGSRGFLASGRLAGSAGGSWRGLRVDAGVDLDDRDRRGERTLEPRDGRAAALVVDPLREFANPGDGAAVDDRSPGRGRLWARVEGESLKLGLGNVRSAVGTGELGQHDRALSGARAEWSPAVGPVTLRATAFAGRNGGDDRGIAPGVPCRDELAATGGSLFYLRHRDLVRGSERVRVEWRDPFSRRVVGTRELVRGRDYALDEVDGRLLLARPLPSVASGPLLASAEPFTAPEAWLRVDYLALQAGEARRGAAGGTVSAAFGPVTFAGGGAVEDRAGPDWRLASGRASLDLGRPLQATVEVARSEGRLFADSGGPATSLDGGFGWTAAGTESGAATAFHAALRGEAGPARWEGWWRERPGGYSDGQFDEPASARERGAAASGDAGPVALRLAWAERRGADSNDPAGTARVDAARAVGSATIRIGDVAVTAEGMHERARLPVDGDQSAAGARVGWRAGGGLTLEASHLQTVARSGDVREATFTAAGASLRAGDTTLGLRGGWGPALGPRIVLSGDRAGEGERVYGRVALDTGEAATPEAGLGAGSAVGGSQRVGAGQLFTEERVVRDPMGVRAGRVVGGTLEIAPGLTVTLTGERGERLRLDGGTAERGAGGLTASWRAGPVQLAGRVEVRTEGSGRQWVAGASGAWSPAPRLTVAARGTWADGELYGRSARTADADLSAAWRSDPLSILARVGRVEDHRDGDAGRDANLAALAVAWRVLSRGRLGAGVEVADQRLAGVSDDRLVGSARAGVAITGPFDVAVEYARRGSLEGRSLGALDAVRAEVGLDAGSVRVAVGYTLVGFEGSGLDTERGDGRVYLRAVAVR